MRSIVAPVRVFHHDFAVAREFVGAEVKPFAGGEKNVPVFHQDTEGDVFRLGKIRPVRPGAPVVLGEENRLVAEAESAVVPLGVDVGTVGGREAIPEMVRFTLFGGVQEQGGSAEDTSGGGGEGSPEKLAAVEGGGGIHGRRAVVCSCRTAGPSRASLLRTEAHTRIRGKSSRAAVMRLKAMFTRRRGMEYVTLSE